LPVRPTRISKKAPTVAYTAAAVPNATTTTEPPTTSAVPAAGALIIAATNVAVPYAADALKRLLTPLKTEFQFIW